MKTFRTAIDIEAPAPRVWEVMSDVDRWHEWTPSIRSVQRHDTGALAVGHRVTIRQPRLPPARWEVNEWEPDRQFTWVSTAPGVQVTARHEVEPRGEGSRANLSLEIRGVLGGLLGWLTGTITQRYLALEAAGLKARSEQPGFRHEDVGA